MNKFLLTILTLSIAFLSFAQQPAETVEMADVMRSNGKIYVVVAVVAIIFTGIIIYLINLDNKITKLEKKIK